MQMRTKFTLLFVPVPKLEKIQIAVLFQQNSSQMGITAKLQSTVETLERGI